MNNDVHAFDLQGHRGCRGLMPENTIPAMLHALELGVTTLEMDVVITADCVCILSHEPFFNHEITTRPDGSTFTESEERSLNIFKMNCAEVEMFDVGMKPHPRFPEQKKMRINKPRLRDMFDSVKQYCEAHHRPLPFFNIETKTKPGTDDLFHPKPARFVELLMQEIEAASVQKQVVIQSFDFRTLQIIHFHYPAIQTSALVEEDDQMPFGQQLEALGFRPDFYSPHYGLVTPELVNQCHDLNLKLVPWTVNDKAEAQKLKALGVDGFITDLPDRLK